MFSGKYYFSLLFIIIAFYLFYAVIFSFKKKIFIDWSIITSPNTNNLFSVLLFLWICSFFFLCNLTPNRQAWILTGLFIGLFTKTTITCNILLWLITSWQSYTPLLSYCWLIFNPYDNGGNYFLALILFIVTRSSMVLYEYLGNA